MEHERTLVYAQIKKVGEPYFIQIDLIMVEICKGVMVNHSKVLMGLMLLAMIAIIGCVATTEETIVPVDQARLDSIEYAQRDSLLRLNRMYAYDYLKRGDWEKRGISLESSGTR